MAKEIVRLAARGDGVSADGDFITGAVPGDIVEGETITAGPHHVVPPCVHFGICGGCQLQHADEEVLAGFARGRILGTLASAQIAPEHVHDVHLSPPLSRRRASLRAVRTPDGIELGFNEEGSRIVVDLHECHVLTPNLFFCAQSLRPYLADLLPQGWVSGITLTATPVGFDALLTNVKADSDTIARLAEWAKAAGVARVSLETPGGIDPVVQRAVPAVRFAGTQVDFPPGAFLQATEDGEAALVRAVLSATEGAKSVADLFGGLGTFAFPLAERARVVAADAARASIQALEKAAKRKKLRIETQHRDLFRRPFSAAELSKFDSIVLDPPRAGAKEQIAMIGPSKLQGFCYVSCNPNTFARDAKILAEAGFRIAELWPVGQFRWSTHVELAARFVR
ncbi:class I SAM-dependent RNA methyltransferase [Pacificimonas sp. ICDLI1SI03]